MSAKGDDDVDYETDPEDSKLTLRRRVASDDEDDDGGAEEREADSLPPRRLDDSDEHSNGEGEAEVEGEEEYYDDDGEEFEEYREEELEREEIEGGGGDDVAGEAVVELGEAAKVEGEKKENEPFAVPTAGAFYMHDDRFRNNVRGRGGRRMLGGRKLWESQNESKWGHDKFEEITVQDRHYNEGPRNPRGRYRVRGKSRGGGNPKGGDKSKVYETYNQNQVPKVTKGRGFKKYDSLKGNKIEAPQMRYRPRSNKAVENPIHANSGRAPTVSQDMESGPVSSTKLAFASRLNSASPPFYPSSSSTKETTTWVQKRDPPLGNINRNVDENATKGRNGVDSVSMSKLHINDHISSNSGKNSTGIINSVNPRAHGRGVSYQTETIPHNQSTRASMPSHFHQTQRNSVQSGRQSSSVHQSRQFRPTGSQIVSNLNTFEQGESNSHSDTIKFKSVLVPKEKSGVQGGGKGSFMYGGSQVMSVSANMGGGHGDQNFGAAPTFSLPAMPFGGQHHHPGGMGVPAVGMAFPGYVAQPNGLGNTEMTWLPILAGSAYGSPYLASALERASSQLVSSSMGASSKENNSNEWKSSPTPEVTDDAEVGQRQKNSRRYTEMKFE